MIKEIGSILFAYLFIYGFAIGFILIGITLFFIPVSPEFPKWAAILISIPFLLCGYGFLLIAIMFKLRSQND